MPRVSSPWLLLTHLLLTCQSCRRVQQDGRSNALDLSVLFSHSLWVTVTGLEGHSQTPAPPFFTVYIHAAPGTVGLWVNGESLLWKVSRCHQLDLVMGGWHLVGVSCLPNSMVVNPLQMDLELQHIRLLLCVAGFSTWAQATGGWYTLNKHKCFLQTPRISKKENAALFPGRTLAASREYSRKPWSFVGMGKRLQGGDCYYEWT